MYNYYVLHVQFLNINQTSVFVSSKVKASCEILSFSGQHCPFLTDLFLCVCKYFLFCFVYPFGVILSRGSSKRKHSVYLSTALGM